MFDLADRDLTDGVADVCAGGSSFVAECHRSGFRALAVDPVYAGDRMTLAAAIQAAVVDGHAIIAANADRFVWHWYGGPDRHRAVRADAAKRFLADLTARPGGYLAGELPRLPLRDRSFGLVVCSHLLFTWSDRFDANWHYAAARELLRVAGREVRIFPLITAGTGDEVPFLGHLIDRLTADGVFVERRAVPYEFQTGGNSMLILTRSAGCA